MELAWRCHLLRPGDYAQTCAKLAISALATTKTSHEEANASKVVLPRRSSTLVDHSPLATDAYSYEAPECSVDEEHVYDIGDGSGTVPAKVETGINLVSAMRRQQRFMRDALSLKVRGCFWRRQGPRRSTIWFRNRGVDCSDSNRDSGSVPRTVTRTLTRTLTRSRTFPVLLIT